MRALVALLVVLFMAPAQNMGNDPFLNMPLIEDNRALFKNTKEIIVEINDLRESLEKHNISIDKIRTWIEAEIARSCPKLTIWTESEALDSAKKYVAGVRQQPNHTFDSADKLYAADKFKRLVFHIGVLGPSRMRSILVLVKFVRPAYTTNGLARLPVWQVDKSLEFQLDPPIENTIRDGVISAMKEFGDEVTIANK